MNAPEINKAIDKTLTNDHNWLVDKSEPKSNLIKLECEHCSMVIYVSKKLPMCLTSVSDHTWKEVIL